MTAPDEPRVTLREDERALREALAEARMREVFGDDYMTAERFDGLLEALHEYRKTFEASAAHVAEQLAPVVAAARTEGINEVISEIIAKAEQWERRGHHMNIRGITVDDDLVGETLRHCGGQLQGLIERRWPRG